MGVLEILLIIAIALKMAGVAFATTSYMVIVGYYIGAVAMMFAITLATVMTIRLFK